MAAITKRVVKRKINVAVLQGTATPPKILPHCVFFKLDLHSPQLGTGHGIEIQGSSWQVLGMHLSTPTIPTNDEAHGTSPVINFPAGVHINTGNLCFVTILVQ